MQRNNTEADWTRDRSPQQTTVSWREDRPPSALRVRWAGSSGMAWWPVNVVRSAALPPPEELRDLPLDTLVDILTSARPVYRILAEHLKRKRIGKDGSSVEIDPHRRVDTSQFLLQRTRRVSWALSALRERLERPVVTKEALNWRLRGPIGVTAVADALLREAGSPEESAFLLAELVLELHRVRPASALGALPPHDVAHEIRVVIRELRSRSTEIDDPSLQNMRQYVERVFATVSS